MTKIVEENNANIAESFSFANDIHPIEDHTENSESEIIEEPKVPKMYDPEWNDYVLRHFESNELDNGNPKVDGLRRVVRKLFGPILAGKAEVKDCPTLDNGQRATVEYTVKVLNQKILEDYEEPYILEFTDAADAWHGNIPNEKFAIYPVAMATTRAEGRALRKAINFTVVTAEEVSDQPVEESAFNAMITESQINKLDVKCSQLDIKLFEELSNYQRQAKKPPSDIKGYEPTWRNVNG
jgi:hypothetical protein